MTLNEIAYNIKNIVEGGISGEDSKISISQIKAMIHYHRARLIGKYSNQGRSFSEWMLSFQAESFSNGAFPLPEIVRFPHNRGIVSFYMHGENYINLHDATIVPVYQEQDLQYHLSSRFSMPKDSIYATIDGSKHQLVIFQNGELYRTWKTYSLKYIAAKPADQNAGYPFPQELIPELTRNILSTEFKVLMSVGNDEINDSLDIKTGRTIPAPQKEKAKAKTK